MAGRLSQNSRLKPVHPLVTIRAAAASGPSGNSLKAFTSPRAASKVLRGARLDLRCWMTASAVSGLSTVSSSSLGVGSRACALPSEGWFLSVLFCSVLTRVRGLSGASPKSLIFFISALFSADLFPPFAPFSLRFRASFDEFSSSKSARELEMRPSRTVIFPRLMSRSRMAVHLRTEHPQAPAIDRASSGSGPPRA